MFLISFNKLNCIFKEDCVAGAGNETKKLLTIISGKKHIIIVILLSSFIFDAKRLQIQNRGLSGKYRKIATFILQAPN